MQTDSTQPSEGEPAARSQVDSVRPDVGRRIVLIVDDEPKLLQSLTIYLSQSGHFRVRSANSLESALESLSADLPDAIVTDLSMHGDAEAGIKLLKAARVYSRDLPVILMSAVASLDALKQAMGARADDYLEKPFRNAALTEKLEAALNSAKLKSVARSTLDLQQAESRPAEASSQRRSQAQSRRHNHPGSRAASAQKTEQRERTRAARPIGVSHAFLSVMALVEQVAASDVTVLFEGESGTGKGVLATYLHAISRRGSGKFLPCNCGAVAETLLESTLFGHVKGAFTDAREENEGLVRAAAGGTLFLDEVGELTLPMQVKLLRVLHEREVIPVGGTVPHQVDARFIAATNKNLAVEVAAGRFRADLFWRLNVLTITVPPLRDRPEDIPLLAEASLAQIRLRDPHVRATSITDGAMAALESHKWPGNVRELHNALERAAVTAGRVIDVCDLPPTIGHADGGNSRPPRSSPFADAQSFNVFTSADRMPTLGVIELAYVQFVTSRCGGDLDKASRTLGIDVPSLRAILATQGPFD